jgi:hypothetical protein
MTIYAILRKIDRARRFVRRLGKNDAGAASYGGADTMGSRFMALVLAAWAAAKAGGQIADLGGTGDQINGAVGGNVAKTVGAKSVTGSGGVFGSVQT